MARSKKLTGEEIEDITLKIADVLPENTADALTVLFVVVAGIGVLADLSPTKIHILLDEVLNFPLKEAR